MSGGDLDALFQAAEYRVFAHPGQAILTRVDVAEPALAALLHERGAQSAVLMSASNPQGQAIAEAENAVRTQALVEHARRLGWRWLWAEGASADRSWVEPCLLVFDLDPAGARQLALDFDQAAWLEYDARGCARLRWLHGDRIG